MPACPSGVQAAPSVTQESGELIRVKSLSSTSGTTTEATNGDHGDDSKVLLDTSTLTLSKILNFDIREH